VYYFTHLVAFYEDNILSFFLRYREIFWLVQLIPVFVQKTHLRRLFIRTAA
jgi:hypothetical protein